LETNPEGLVVRLKELVVRLSEVQESALGRLNRELLLLRQAHEVINNIK
jgi:hypothetical protein